MGAINGIGVTPEACYCGYEEFNCVVTVVCFPCFPFSGGALAKILKEGWHRFYNLFLLIIPAISMTGFCLKKSFNDGLT